MRVRIFIDFWNFQLQWNAFHEKAGQPDRVRIPWDSKLTPTICDSIAPGSDHAGTHVYASIDPRNRADSGLRRFLNVMDGFPGYKVTVKDRNAFHASLVPRYTHGSGVGV